jgi:dihydropyrimidinase
VRDYHARAAGQSFVDYGFHLIVSRPGPEVLGGRGVKVKTGDEANVDGLVDEDGGELKTMVEQEGITSVKLYMTYPAYRLGDREMLDVMMRCREVGMTVMVHAENADMIDM